MRSRAWDRCRLDVPRSPRMAWARGAKSGGGPPSRPAAATAPFSLTSHCPARACRAWAQSDGTEEAAGDVDGVLAVDRFAGDVDREGRLPQCPGDHRARQQRRVPAGRVVQSSELARGIGQDPAQSDLTGVGEVRPAQRVSHLRMQCEGPVPGLPPGVTDPVDVPVDPVDRRAVDVEPAATVDPRPPLTRPGDRCVRAGDLSREDPEAGDVQWWPVVDAEVHVGRCGVGATGPAAAEDHADDAADGGQPPGEFLEPGLVHHPSSMPGGRPPSRSCGR